MTVSERVTHMLGNQLIALAEKDTMIEELQAKIRDLETQIAELQPKSDPT